MAGGPFAGSPLQLGKMIRRKGSQAGSPLQPAEDPRIVLRALCAGGRAVVVLIRPRGDQAGDDFQVCPADRARRLGSPVCP